MTDPDELGRAIESIARALDGVAARWAIGGSMASATHGEPRATNDVDVVAELDEPRARRLTQLLGIDFYADADIAAEAVRTRGSFNVIDKRSFIKIDVFVPPPGPMGMGQLDRRQFLEIVPSLGALPVLGPEDVVLQKLRWYEIGGRASDRQWRDIVSVLCASGGALDDRYLDEVAAGAGLADLLRKARLDAAS